MAQIKKKVLNKIKEFRDSNPSKELDSLLLDYLLDNNISKKRELEDFISSKDKDLSEIFQREELYRLINREKAKVRYREKDLDKMRRTIANNGGFSRLDFDRNMEYFDWLQMNVRNNFSKMSNEELEDFLNMLIEFNLSTKSHEQRVDLIIKGKIVQFLISAKRGASDEALAAMRETTVQYIMVVKNCDKNEAEDIFDEMLDEVEEDYNFGRNNLFTNILNEKVGDRIYGEDYW